MAYACECGSSQGNPLLGAYIQCADCGKTYERGEMPVHETSDLPPALPAEKPPAKKSRRKA